MIGEPDAGKPHVRFDEGVQETCDIAARLRPTLQTPPVGEDAVSTLQEFLNYGLGICHVPGVLLFVHAIADVPVDGVPVVRGVRIACHRQRVRGRRTSAIDAQQLEQAGKARHAKSICSENQRAD